jgi:lipoyl(octanoyl) transferase
MAVDEVLLEGVATGTAPPTLRFYGWSPPGLSLGYFQPFDAVNLDGCRALGVDIIRRPTGGRAILHDRELTYAVALPASLLGHDFGVLPSYQRLSLALHDGLRRLGIPATLAPATEGPQRAEQGPACFDRPSAHEILLFGRKLVGSAQVRRGGALLQHGSILVEPRIDNLVACLRLPNGSGRTRLAEGVAGLAEVGDFQPSEVAGAIAEAFAERFGIGVVESALRPEELAAAGALADSKYHSAGWTERVALEGAGNSTRTR